MQPRGSRSVVISFRLHSVIGWFVTVLACVIPVVVWATMLPLNNRFDSFYGVMSSLGQVLGLIGMVLYALNLLYSTRLRFLEDWFGGLNRVYIAHHVIGGLALICLSFHPVFLALRFITTSIRSSALQLLPNGLTPVSALFNKNAEAHSVVLNQWANFFGIIAFLGMVVLLILTFYVKLPYRFWLFTHKFLGVAFFIGGLHVLFISSDTSAGFLKWYFIAFSILGLAAYTYHTLLGGILIRRYKYYVDDVSVVGGNVTQLEMRPVKLAMNFKPGQFIFVRFLYSGADKVTTEWHPFSISSKPNDDYLRISVKALGDYTKALTGLQKGSIAEVEGAYGRFSYTNYANTNQIWVAGGIGITPFLSMARSLPDTGYKVDLYYSVKTRSELVDIGNLVVQMQLKPAVFRIIPFVGDEQKAFISAEYIAGVSGGLSGKEVFVCGPPPMMKSLRGQFKKAGVLKSSIHTEEFALS